MKRLAAALLVAALGGAAFAQNPSPQQSALAGAAALRGPLEGRWRVETLAGRPLFAFEFADAAGPDPRAASPDAPALEGAWRDLRRPTDKTASGVFDNARRGPDRLALSLSEGAPPQTVRLALRRGRDGVWTGRLAGAGGSVRVVMRRPGRP